MDLSLDEEKRKGKSESGKKLGDVTGQKWHEPTQVLSEMETMRGAYGEDGVR